MMATRAYGSVNLEHVENTLADAGGPRPEILGTIQSAQSSVPPPPWEIGEKYDAGDARSIVDVPADWTLRWLNPRWIDREGWRYWQKVDAKGDSRVHVKNESCIQADNTIRRGGPTGDILGWMHTSWVASMRKRQAKRADDLMGTTQAKREQLNEQFKRGTFGEGISGEIKHTTSPVNEDTFRTVAR